MAVTVDEEMAAVEKLHQAAQARLGIAAAYLALSEWQSVHALNSEDTSNTWVLVSLRIITAVRKLSRQLAISYYQLARSLETGSTLGELPGSTGDVTLGDVRKNFRDTALDIAALPSPRTLSDDPDIRWFEEELKARDMPEATTPGRLIRLEDAQVDPLVQDLLDVEGPNNSEPITTDEFDWDEALTREEVTKRFEDLLRQQIKDAADKTRALRSSPELTPEQAITQIEKSHQAAGSTGSGTVDEIGMEGGRQVIDTAIRQDRRIKLIARGTSGNPCAFCSMLASRGFVYAGTTSGVGDGSMAEDDIKRYHPNCHCFPIVKFTTESQLPALNKYFQAQWPDVTDGYSGVDALNAWRRWIYAQRKKNPADPFGAFANKPT